MIKEKILNIKLTKEQKLILTSIGILLCILIIMFIYKGRGNQTPTKDENLIALFDEKRPIVIKKDELYGYISTKGESIIEPTFLSASPFWNGFAIVSKEEAKYEVIDKNGNTILTAKKDVEPKYYKEAGVWLIDDTLYDRNLHPIFEGNYRLEYISNGYFSVLDNGKKESGIISSSGQKVFTWDQDYITVSISEIDYKEDLYAIVNNFEEDEAIISLKSGKIIYKIEDPQNKYLRQESNGIFRIINRQESYKTEKWLYLKDEKIAYETDEEIYLIKVEDYTNEILKIDYGQNFADLNEKSRYKYYDLKNDKYSASLPIDNSTPYLFQRDFNIRLIKEDEKYGLIADDAKLINEEYDKINFLEYNLHKYLFENYNTQYILLEKSDKTELYNVEKKKSVKEFNSTAVMSNKDSLFLTVSLYEQNGYTKRGYLIYNVLTGKEIELDKSTEFEIYTNYISVTINGYTSYYNADLKEVYREGDS